MKLIHLLPLPLISACSLLPPEPLDDLSLEDKSARVSQEVARIRDLELTAVVPVGVKTKAELEQVFQAEIDESWEQDGADVERAYRAFGLIPEELDLKPFMVEFMKDNVGGYYDPEKKEFFTIEKGDSEEAADKDDPDDFDPDKALVLPHELVHAIDDQHFDLETLSDRDHRDGRDDDAELAFSALVEGSAMEGGIDHILWRFGYPGSTAGPLLAPLVARLSSLSVAELNKMSLSVGDSEEFEALKQAPAIISQSMFFPYLQGWAFVNQLRREFGWQAVDGAYADLPESSEQILHPERYFDRRDRPVKIELPAPPNEWKSVASGTLGMFGMRVLLGTLLDEYAEDDSDGWDGDRYAIWDTPDGDAIGWVSVWDRESEARSFAKTYSVLLENSQKNRERWAVVRQGDLVAVAQNTPEGQAQAAAESLLTSKLTRAPDDQAPERWFWKALRFPLGLRFLDRAFEAHALGGLAVDYRSHAEGHRFELLNSLLLRSENNPDRTALWMGLGLIGFTSDRTLDYSFARIPALINWHGRGTGAERSQRLSLLLSSIDYRNIRGDGRFQLLWGLALKVNWGPSSSSGKRLRILLLPIPGI